MTDVNSCICSECHKWHSHIKQRLDGKFVCINCYYQKKLNNGDKKSDGRNI